MSVNLLPIANIASAGVNSDLMPWDLPHQFVTDIRNVRIASGKLMPFNGYTVWFEFPFDFGAGHIMNINTNENDFWVIAGTEAVFVYDSVNFEDVRRAGFLPVLDANQWSSCMLSSIPILNHPSDYPQYWDPQELSTLLQLLPWDGTQDWEAAGRYCKIIRSHKQYLFALGVNNDEGFVPDGVRWSSPADIQGVPETWDEFDNTSVAGITRLGADGGPIIDGLSLRDAFVVYRENAISVFDYVGGIFVWQVRHLSTAFGLLAKECLVEVNGNHYFIGRDDIYVNDGNTITSLLHKRLKTRFITDFNKEYFANAFVVKYDIADEIWFCIPSYENGNEMPDVAYVYNWRDGSWTITDLPDGGIPSAAYGTVANEFETWATVPEQWFLKNGPWNVGGLAPVNTTLVAIQDDDQYTGINGAMIVLDALNAEIPHRNIYFERLGMPIQSIDRVTTLSRVYPHMDGPGECTITFGSQDYPGSAVRWAGPQNFTPSDDRKLDFRTTGELHCYKVSSNEFQGRWELSGIDLEYTEAGKR